MSAPSPSPGRLSISSAVQSGTASIALRGELDLASAPQLEALLQSIETDSPQRVVVDLGELAFIDSTGLRLLLQASARSGERDCEFVLRPGEDAVQRVFDLTGARNVLRFEEEGEEGS